MEESPKRGLLAAYGRLLGPLVRILIRNGVTFEEFSNTAKQSYVEVANQYHKVGEEEPADDKLAVLTGLKAQEIIEIKSHLKASSDQDQDLLDVFVIMYVVKYSESST